MQSSEMHIQYIYTKILKAFLLSPDQGKKILRVFRIEREREREGFRMKAGVVNMLPVSREKSDFRDLDLVIQPQLVAHTQK